MLVITLNKIKINLRLIKAKGSFLKIFEQILLIVVNNQWRV